MPKYLIGRFMVMVLRILQTSTRLDPRSPLYDETDKLVEEIKREMVR